METYLQNTAFTPYNDNEYSGISNHIFKYCSCKLTALCNGRRFLEFNGVIPAKLGDFRSSCHDDTFVAHLIRHLTHFVVVHVRHKPLQRHSLFY